MGIFNRSIPTYTVDTANKLRITTPVEEPEQQSTYIDDAFDPVFNKAVRDRLMKEWGDPITAAAAGYYELLDNSIVGSTKQWGALGSGMGILSSFGRTMDKGGDLVLGTLTEGIKGVTGQGVESPFHNIFVKDQDYSGGRILAAMGNSIAKLANAPQLTEEDFGGIWQIPSIGIELATDPGILGNALTKVGGGVGKLSTAEVLTNLGRAGRSPLADVGQLLSNYDDAMSKIALDVTAPGTRFAVDKFKTHVKQAFKHSSPEDYVDRILIAVKNRDTEGLKKIHREMKKDTVLKKQLDLNAAQTEQIKNIGSKQTANVDTNVDTNVKQDPFRNRDIKPLSEPVPTELDDLTIENTEGVETPSSKKDTVKDLKDRKVVFGNDDEYVHYTMRDKIENDVGSVNFEKFSPKKHHTKIRIHDDFNTFVAQVKEVQADLDFEKELQSSSIAAQSASSKLDKPTVLKTTTKSTLKPHNHNVHDFLKTNYKTLSAADKLNYLLSHTDYFEEGTKATLLAKQTWFKNEVSGILKNVLADPKHETIKYTRRVDKNAVSAPRIVKKAKPSDDEYVTALYVIDHFRGVSGDANKAFDFVKKQADGLRSQLHTLRKARKYGVVYDTEFKKVLNEFNKTMRRMQTFVQSLPRLGVAKVPTGVLPIPDQAFFDEELFKNSMSLYEAFLIKEAYERPDTYHYLRPILKRQQEATELLRNVSFVSELADMYRALTDKSKAYPLKLTKEGVVPVPKTAVTVNHPTGKLYNTIKDVPHEMYGILRRWFDMSEDDFAKYISEKESLNNTRNKYLSNLKTHIGDFTSQRNKIIHYMSEDLLKHPALTDYDDVDSFARQYSSLNEWDTDFESVLNSLTEAHPEWSEAIEEFKKGLFKYTDEYDEISGNITSLEEYMSGGMDDFEFFEIFGVKPDEVDFDSRIEDYKTLLKNANPDFEDFTEYMYEYFSTLNISESVAAQEEFNKLLKIKTSMRPNAVVTVSPSTIYNIRSTELLRNAMAYVESRLNEIFKDYDYFNRIDDRAKLWKRFKNDPVLQNILTPDWKFNNYIDDLELLFRTAGLPLPPKNSRLRENFFNEIVSGKYPALREALKVNDKRIDDFSKAVFGDGKHTWVPDNSYKRGHYETRYSAHRQFLAMDSFTQNIIDTIRKDVLEAYTHAGFTQAQGLIDIYGVERLLDPEALHSIFKGISKDKLDQIYATLQRQLNGDFYSELYSFAKDAQDNVFKPIKLQIGMVDSETLADIEKYDKFYAKHINNIDYTYDLNKLIRERPDAFKTIGDVHDFYSKSYTYTPAERSASVFDPFVNTPAEYLEFKFKDIGRLRIEGSSLPQMILEYSKVYKDKYVDSYLLPIRNYLEAAKNAEDLARRKKVLNTIAKSKPEQTIEELLTDLGGVDSDIRKLFTKYDLTPDYVQDVLYNHEKSVGNKLVNEEITRAKLEAQPPKALAEAPVVTQDNAAVETLHEVAGTEEVAKTVDELTEGKGADALTPEDVEVIKNEFGEEAYSVFKLVSDAAVSNAKAKLTKTNTLETIVGRKLSEIASELVKKYGNTKAWDGLEMYDAIQTALHGDSVPYAELMDEIMASGGRVGILSSKGVDPNVQAALTDFVNEVNRQLNTKVLKLHTSANDFGQYIGVVLDYDNASKILRTDFRKLKFDDTKRVIFENPFKLTDNMKKFKESAEYADFENFATRMSEYTQDLHKYVGFNYKDGVHVKHVLRFNPEQSVVIKGIYAGIDLDKVSELSKRMLNSDSFKHMYGTFGVVRPGRSLRGNVFRYNRGEYKTFNFNPERVLSSTFTEGVLGNSEVQSFVGLFVNDNFKVSQYFKDADELIDVLYAKNANGKISGNLDNLEVVAPVYDENGKVLRFKYFDKTSRAALDSAIKTKDAILVPSSLVAHLDIWCKKDAKMSNRIYRFFNKYFSLPYKFGVLANPGFLLGNIGDAYLKQATTLSQKYGTNFTEEVANVATSLREVYHLNNVAMEAYVKIIDALNSAGVHVPPFERPIESLNLNNNARQRIVDYLNGKLLNGAGEPVPLPENFTNADADALRVWMYINTFQTTKNLGEGFRDVSKEGLFKDVGSSVIERIFYGSKKFSFKNPDWKKVKNWGLFLNNPWINAIFDASGSLEAYFRSANVLNSLKHAGYDTHNLAKLLGEGYDAATSEKLHVDTINALNVMFNSNFNYDAQSELMHKLSYVVPFPTFFIKNFAYWMELLIENPEYIDTALTIQEGLWNDREEEVKEDRFMAEAKGRGAVPISDGDNKGLSKLFKGIYKPTPLNSMFGAFNLLNNPVEDLTNRVHPLINAPLQMLQAEMGQRGIGLATQEDATDIKYRPYSMNKFEKNIPYTSPDFDWREYLFHKLNPQDRGVSNALRLPHKLGTGDVQLSDILPSVFQPDF